MSDRPQLTFVPGALVPAGGRFALWRSDGGDLDHDAQRLGLPGGETLLLPSVALGPEGLTPADRPARGLPVLTTIRRLATLPPGSDLPAWSRPSASVLAWSVASKLALELVAAGRLLPTLRPAEVPGTAIASWRVAAPVDGRLEQLAAGLPVAAHALRRPAGGLWEPLELLRAFLDAVADACAREGRRPEVDPRRRGPRRAFGEMWAEALIGSDPTVAHLRVPADRLGADLAEWAEPVLGDDREVELRLLLRLEPPDTGDDGSEHLASRLAAVDLPWRLTFLLQAPDDADARVLAAQVWEQPGAPLEVGGHVLRDPEMALVRGLAAGARLFPPLDRSLSEAEPRGLDLSVAEVAELITGGSSALSAAGIAVEVPPELRDASERRLRLRVRLGRSSAEPPRVEGAPPLALTSLTDLRYEVAIGDDELTPDEFAQLVSMGRPLVRWRGSWVRIDADEAELVGQLAGQSGTLELAEALAAALSGQHRVEDLGLVEAFADGDLAEAIGRLRAAGELSEARIVGISGNLRPYQERGVAWLQQLTDLGMGAVLADEMGLGKTLMAIALLASRPGDRPHLVVCPTSVVGNWERELARFAPDLEVLRHHGPERAVSRRDFRPGSVSVTSYALLRRDIGLLEDVDWDVVVLDEAQQIKNPSSKGARAARSLTSRARVAMTGTPLENRLSELWSIVDATNPGLLGSQRAFNERFAVPIERWHDADAARRLRRLVAPFLLRRHKNDAEVSVDLPPKQEVTVACTLTREQASLYQAAVDEAFRGGGLGASAFERRGRILALLTALKQICNHPAQYLRDGSRLPGRSGKLARATEILAELVDADERALVFTQYREMGELLVRHLGEHVDLPGVPFLHGGVPLSARDEMVDRFQVDEEASPLLIVSLRAGGTGLNLTRASHVLHYDRWWNPAVEDQATDRAHRIGQTRAVTVHTLVTAGTVEDRIAGVLERKRSLADAIVGSGETWITELDDDELRELVSLSTVGLADEDEDVEVARPTLTALPGGRA